jgi:hypothetical protein
LNIGTAVTHTFKGFLVLYASSSLAGSMSKYIFCTARSTIDISALENRFHRSESIVVQSLQCSPLGVNRQFDPPPVTLTQFSW